MRHEEFEEEFNEAFGSLIYDRVTSCGTMERGMNPIEQARELYGKLLKTVDVMGRSRILREDDEAWYILMWYAEQINQFGRNCLRELDNSRLLQITSSGFSSAVEPLYEINGSFKDYDTLCHRIRTNIELQIWTWVCYAALMKKERMRALNLKSEKLISTIERLLKWLGKDTQKLGILKGLLQEK